MELQELYEKLLSQGCNRFYIEGVGGPVSDDVDCLGEKNGYWEVYYSERGQNSKAAFSNPDKNKAIEFYYNLIIKLEHSHLVVFTRSQDIMNLNRAKLENSGISVKQNDIPDFNTAGDRVYRLFVVNKDIFKAKEILEMAPYFDKDFDHLF